ncbi:MAG TPA: ATP-grasp domain-containing protein [Gemmatimonadales bacterium]|nr:ATP-grasp domain-containing protein [Gemmatimonadales bacterium]
MKVVVIYDAGSQDWSPQDVAAVLENVREVREVLRARGHDAELVPVRLGDFRWLTRCRKADLVFNLCEGINGHARYEDFVLGALELTGTPFTGPRAWPITVCHRKHVANTLLAGDGIPVPAFVLAQGNKIPANFPLPAIVKPAAEDASVGIDSGAVCTSRRALRSRVSQMLEHFDEVLVQEYVAGREINVGFVGETMLPISEIDFSRMPDGSWPIVTYAAKWAPDHPEYAGTEPVCPARLPADVARRVAKVARSAWQLLGNQEGYGRVDLRLNADGQPFVIEVNPCPDLSRDAGLARMARAHGWEYDELVMQIVEEALTRSRKTDAAAALVALPPRTPGEVPA